MPRQNIQRWTKKSDTFREVVINQIQGERRIRRLRKGQGKYTRLEEDLVGYISSEREKGHCISKSMQRKARLKIAEIYPNSTERLNASSGWTNRFLKRHSDISRRVTGILQGIPEDACDKILRFTSVIKQEARNYEII